MGGCTLVTCKYYTILHKDLSIHGLWYLRGSALWSWNQSPLDNKGWPYIWSSIYLIHFHSIYTVVPRYGGLALAEELASLWCLAFKKCSHFSDGEAIRETNTDVSKEESHLKAWYCVWMVAGFKWYLHTMEYYSAIERNKVLIHATVWMHLENTMLTKRHISYDLTYVRYLEEANS